jgi:hypothetical protein
MPSAIYTKLKRDETGRALCRWCEKPVPKGRRTFCGEDCVHEWNIRTDPAYARRQVHKRDHGVCSVCHIDTDRLQRIADRLHTLAFGRTWKDGQFRSAWTRDDEEVHMMPFRSHERRHQQLEIMVTLLSLWAGHWVATSHWRGNISIRHLWEADHIVPVIEGGGECGLENLRTVCLRCHKDATKKLAARRARAKRPQQELFGETP